MAKVIAPFVPVNNVEKGEEEEEVEIRTTMQFSVAMQQSCTCHQGNCFFPVNNEEEKMKKEVDEEEEGEEEEEEEEIHNHNAVFYGNKQSCTCGKCNNFFPVNEEEIEEKDK